jgi:NAD dependent epimerase/dehydratase family enzyme
MAFGEFGAHIVDSARAIPDAAYKAGYTFRYPELGPALRNLLG